MSEPLAYLDGCFVPFSEASLPLHDAGFVWGATVVDNCRTYRGVPFRWSDHLSRFRRDCQDCFVPLETSDEELTAAAHRLIAANRRDTELQIVTFATPGTLGFYTGEASNGTARIGMVTYPVPLKRFRRFFTEGIALAAAVNPHFTPSHFNDTLVSPKVKHRSRMAWWVAERALASVGYPAHAVPLFFDAPGGSPTETSFANLLAVVDGTVVTPPRHLILEGISLRVTEELCGQLGIPFRESRIEPFAPPYVSEAMLVGSGFGIAAVRSFQASPESPPTVFAWPGPIFQRLLAGWSELTGTGIECEFSETAVN